MATIRLPPEFREFLRLLSFHKVEYLLVGGYSVGFYGYPRATGDIDVWIDRNADNAGRIRDALIEFGFNRANVSSDLFAKENQVIRIGVPPLRIDILTSVSGISFSESYPQRVIANADGVDLSIISLADLRRNKLASGRHKDLADLENLPE